MSFKSSTPDTSPSKGANISVIAKIFVITLSAPKIALQKPGTIIVKIYTVYVNIAARN